MNGFRWMFQKLNLEFINILPWKIVPDTGFWGCIRRKIRRALLSFWTKLSKRCCFPSIEFRRIAAVSYLDKSPKVPYGIGNKVSTSKARLSYLNGKVERAQLTDIQELYSLIDLESVDLVEEFGYWQHYYNWVPAPWNYQTENAYRVLLRIM